jgi:1-acyl-sn-glycerol-3-phosphate acyltransferase
MSWYGAFAAAVRLATPLAARVRVTGLDNIPSSGPFLLIANHQGLLDPILIQAFCPRTVFTLTKSSQFRGPVFRWLLPRLNAIPVRRYQVDPQVVRVALRVLEGGQALGLYPEGERAWDGRLQPFRLGSIRLMLKAGVPVLPARIDGSYDVWPRWSRIPRRAGVRIHFGVPLYFGRHDRRRDREAALPDAIRRTREALGAAA